MAATQVACTGRARPKAVGARARAERTEIMPNMFVTLDVSKLSGWLNALAYCRVERRACNARRGAAREAWRKVAATQCRRAHGEGPTQGWGARARVERTLNMRSMVVTLEVSQLEMSALKFFKL